MRVCKAAFQGCRSGCTRTHNIMFAVLQLQYIYIQFLSQALFVLFTLFRKLSYVNRLLHQLSSNTKQKTTKHQILIEEKAEDVIQNAASVTIRCICF